MSGNSVKINGGLSAHAGFTSNLLHRQSQIHVHIYTQRQTNTLSCTHTQTHGCKTHTLTTFLHTTLTFYCSFCMHFVGMIFFHSEYRVGSLRCSSRRKAKGTGIMCPQLKCREDRKTKNCLSPVLTTLSWPTKETECERNRERKRKREKIKKEI